MKLSLRFKMGSAMIMVALIPALLAVIILEGSLFAFFEKQFESNEIVMSYDRANTRHDLFTALVKKQIKEDESAMTNGTLSYLDSNKEDTLLGFYVMVDNKEEYRSPWLNKFELDLNLSSEEVDDEWIDEYNISIINSTEIITPDHNYVIFTLLDYSNVAENLGAFAGWTLLGVVSIFAIIIFLLILWVFRHIRESMRQLVMMTESILTGDLKNPVPYSQKDEFSELADVINTLRLNLYDSNLEKEHLEKERERMLANIAHDIKTPITAIKGCAQMLSEGVIHEEKAKKEYLDIIVSRSHVIEHMVNDLKEVIKYDVGSIKLDFAPVKLGYFIDDCIDDFRINNMDQAFKIEFERTYADLMIQIDPNLIQRVFKNIIGNALKYNRHEEVDIQIDTDKVGNIIRFKISDDGIGVPDASLDKLFDRLYRVDASRNSTIEGSGIGLSICKEIIEAHGGQIWAENTGGRFSILFSIPVTGD